MFNRSCLHDRVAIVDVQYVYCAVLRARRCTRRGSTTTSRRPARRGSSRSSRATCATAHCSRAPSSSSVRPAPPTLPHCPISRASPHTPLAVYIRVVMLFEYSDWISIQRCIRLNVQCAVCSFTWSSEALSEKLDGLQHNNVNVHRFSKAL